MESIKDRARIAYYRRFGSHAAVPLAHLTEVFDRKGQRYVRLANARGTLAVYRITQRNDGRYNLAYVGPKQRVWRR